MASNLAVDTTSCGYLRQVNTPFRSNNASICHRRASNRSCRSACYARVGRWHRAPWPREWPPAPDAVRVGSAQPRLHPLCGHFACGYVRSRSRFPSPPVLRSLAVHRGRVGETWIIEDPYFMGIQVRGHALGKTNARQSAEHHNAVVAGENTIDLIGMSLCQQRQSHSGMIITLPLLRPTEWLRSSDC